VRIALSYAQQANFNLPEALAAAKEAVKLDPEASLAWARLAELWMSQGDLDEALDAARKAEALNPREVRIQTVLGFAYLTQIKIDAAKNAFESRASTRRILPLVGLAKIRRRPNRAAKEIRIAATLDPNNALIRSYLGKPTTRNAITAAIQLGIARTGPMNPTLSLRQFASRPSTVSEALPTQEWSAQHYRAVYRSQLLLDNDLSPQREPGRMRGSRIRATGLSEDGSR
jgi:tetratricopeptide (TPR) repeat protein